MKTVEFRSRMLVIAGGLMFAALWFAAGGFPGRTSPAAPEVLAAEPAPAPGDSKAPATAPGAEPLEAADVPAAAPAPKPAVAKLSAAAAEVVRLTQAGVGEDVVLAFIANYTSLFNLTADQIIYLSDIGISSKVIQAMVQRDLELKKGGASGAPEGAFPPQIAAPAPAPQPEPASPDYAPDYSTYDAGYYAGQPDYAPPEPSSSYFEDSLAPYGSWVDVPDYGRCWQPSVLVVNHEWRPYCDRGRWIDTDCGWYWQSDYSWGWAPFHYGRWFEDARLGWVWRPGRVWGPAWVSWRRSTDYCGWAPLPPGARFVPGVGFRFGNRTVGADFEFGLRPSAYTFVPLERFTDYAPDRHRVAPWEEARVHGETVVFNRLTFHNHQLVHHGLDRAEVEAASRTEIRRAVVREAAGTGGGPRMDRLEKIGDSLVILRPHLPPPVRRGGTATPAVNQVSAPNGPGPGTSSGAPVFVRRDEPAPARKPQALSPLPNMNLGGQGARPGAASGPPPNQPPGATRPPLIMIGRNQISPSEAPAPRHSWGPLPNMNLSDQAAGAVARAEPESAPPASPFVPRGPGAGWQVFQSENSKEQFRNPTGAEAAHTPGYYTQPNSPGPNPRQPYPDYEPGYGRQHPAPAQVAPRNSYYPPPPSVVLPSRSQPGPPPPAYSPAPYVPSRPEPAHSAPVESHPAPVQHVSPPPPPAPAAPSPSSGGSSGGHR